MPTLAVNTEFEIRPATAADLDAVIHLDTQITAMPKVEYWHGIFERFGRRETDGFFLVATSGERVLGFVVGEIRAWEFGSDPCGWIFAIEVSPDLRMNKVGSALYAALCANFRKAGVSRIRTMLARDAQLVMQFFRSQGMMAGPFIQLEKELDE